MKLHGQSLAILFLVHSPFAFCLQECCLQFSRVFVSVPLFTTLSRRGGGPKQTWVSFWYLQLLEMNPCTLSNHSNRKEKRTLFVSHGLYFGSTTFTAKTSPFILFLVGSRVIWSTLLMLQESAIAFYFLARSPNLPQYFSFETDVLLN